MVEIRGRGWAPGAACFLLTLGIVLSPALAMAQTERRPNIVLIVADYLGYGDTGPYGVDDIRTPSLDRLAAQGVRFTDHYAAAPICGPSRAALMSGFYPPRVGFENNIRGPEDGLRARDSTLVRELKAAGYATAMIGKWHLGNGPDFDPTAHGFDSFFGFHTWTLGYHDHRTSEGQPGLFRDRELVETDGYLTDLFTRESVAFVERQSDRPFFLYLAYNTGLPPYQGPDLPESQWEAGWDVNQASRADLVAMVESMDRGIGEVLAALERTGVAENTFVVFTYDHGGRHLVRSDPLFHGFATVWEGGIRVPLIARWPGELRPAATVEDPTIAMDVTATLLDAAGRAETITELDGVSLLPMLRNEAPAPDRGLFWRIGSFAGGQKAARRGRWKYVVDGDTQLLFDLRSDVGERHNAFADRPDVARQLREALAAWERSVTQGLPR